MLDNVYYYNLEKQRWERSFIISIIPKTKRYIIAQHGPSVPLVRVLHEDEYIKLHDAKELTNYTEQVNEVI